MILISFEIITDETTMKMLSYRYPERSLNDPAMECCLLPLAHLQQSLPIFPPHERLATHFFSTFFFPFFFFSHHSIKKIHHSQHASESFITREFLEPQQQVPRRKCPGWIEGRARVEEADEIRTDASILPLAHPHRCLFDQWTSMITDASYALAVPMRYLSIAISTVTGVSQK